MKLDLSFAGGSEVLFDDKREHKIDVPADTNVKQLIGWITSNLVVDREKLGLLFVNGDVRPGILLLVNDVDWEITGGVSCSFYCLKQQMRIQQIAHHLINRRSCLQLNTKLYENDSVTFISTLHGG